MEHDTESLHQFGIFTLERKKAASIIHAINAVFVLKGSNKKMQLENNFKVDLFSLCPYIILK